MNSLHKYFFLAVLAYLFFLVKGLPAGIPLSYLQGRQISPLGTISLRAIQGTWLAGTVENIDTDALRLSDVRWQVHPSALLTGRLRFNMQGSTVNDGRFQGTVSAGPGGNITLTDPQCRIPADQLKNLLTNNLGLELSGFIIANLQQARIEEGIIRQLNGIVAWEDAALGRPANIQIGDFKINFKNEGDIIKGMVTDGGGPMQTEGVLTLHTDGRYSFSGFVAARSRENVELVNLLKLVGRETNGRIAVAMSGDARL